MSDARRKVRRTSRGANGLIPQQGLAERPFQVTLRQFSSDRFFIVRVTTT